MVFAFPAYHEETKTFRGAGLLTLKACIRDALDEIGWNCHEDHGYWDGGTSVNMLSWGENIEIEILDDDESIRIKSSCKMPTQCIDWGKNKKNVFEFLVMVEELLEDVDD